MHKWLAHNSSAGDKLRLHAMGNIVIPAQASVAVDFFFVQVLDLILSGVVAS